MRVLVAYASRYGATAEIAKRIADRITEEGHDADCASVSADPLVGSYDAFVVGSAVYMGKWERDARAFVETHRDVLATRPTWLFSSGPLGTGPTLENGEDKIHGAVSAEQLEELTQAVHPRGHAVFFGALDADRLGVGLKIFRMVPAGRKLLEEGDFRDWDAIESWADEIGDALAEHAVAAVPVP